MPVQVQGPDGKTYQFPDNTDKSAAIAYFKKKGIGAPVQAAPSGPPDSVAGGAYRRSLDILRGLGDTFKPASSIGGYLAGPALPAARMARGAISSGREAINQAGEYSRQANEIKGDPITRLLLNLRAGTAAASALNPLASGSVTNINRLNDQGREREALGQALPDLLMLRLGGSSEPSPTTMTNKLAFAAGKDTTAPIAASLKDIRSAATPPPTNVDALLSTVKRANSNLNSEVGSAMAPVQSTQIFPSAVAQRIRSLITPNMSQTVEGQAEIARINAAARQFEKPWTIQQLDAERTQANSDLNSFYKKGVSDKYSAAIGNRTIAIDKAIADSIRDTVYPILDRTANKPSGYFAALKRRQGSLIELEDSLTDQTRNLKDTTSRIKGGPRISRDNIGVYAGPSGAHGYLHGLMDILHKPDPLATANKRVAQAFGQTPRQAATRSIRRASPFAPATTEDNR